MKLSHILVSAIGILSLTSCFNTDMHSPEARFVVENVAVPADTTSGDVVCLVPVTSTESWNASVKYSEDWISLKNADCLNPTGVERTQKLEVSCDDNESYTPRTAVIVLKTPTATKEIILTQRGKKDRVAVFSQKVVTVEPEYAKEITFEVKSNTDWTVSSDPSSTAEVKTITLFTGHRDGYFTVTMNPNYDCVTEKVAVLLVSAPGVDADTVRVIQKKNAPFIRTLAKDLDIKQFPTATSGVLNFDSNAEWKAEVLSSNINSFALVETEGPGAMGSVINYVMLPNEGTENLQAQVKVSLKDHPDQSAVFTVTHWAGIVLNVSFVGVTSDATCPLQPALDTIPVIPFTSDNDKSLNTGSKAYTYKYSQGGKDYLFDILNKEVNVQNGYIRLSEGYIKFPAIADYRLAYVEFTTAATNKKYSIAENSDGTGVIGQQKTVAKDATAQWTFEDTKYNTSYYEIIVSGRSRQTNIILLYVK